MKELKIQNLSLMLNWPQGFEAVELCEEELVELLDKLNLIWIRVN